MNLTNTLRTQLIRSVIKNQYQGKVDDLQSKIKEQLTETAKGLPSTETVEILKAALGDRGSPGDFLRITRLVEMNSNLVIAGSIKFDPIVARYRNAYPIFIIDYSLKLDFDVHNNSLWNSRVNLNCKKTQSLSRQVKQLFDEAELIANDLSAVLQSVRTVKKLKEITHIFNDFLPTEKEACTALIPAEALCRVNSLNVGVKS